eukprot:scaffold439_cov415-Prasinococcus_capsulatus_cf.AAC.33
MAEPCICPPSAIPFITEFHYDDSSGGVGEFIEVAVPCNIDLVNDDVKVLIVDGGTSNVFKWMGEIVGSYKCVPLLNGLCACLYRQAFPNLPCMWLQSHSSIKARAKAELRCTLPSLVPRYSPAYPTGFWVSMRKLEVNPAVATRMQVLPGPATPSRGAAWHPATTQC